MFRCVQNVMDSESLQMCRLCLVREDLVYIFNPKGCLGFRLWEIIEELLKEEVSKEDGLPWTICKGCVGKLKDFKQFKMTCIRAKTSILTMIANRDIVSNIKKEEVEADELLTGGEICSQQILCLDESACTGVLNDSSLANPLDLSDMKEEADSSKSLLDAETCNQDNDQHNENLAIPVSNVVCLPIEFGDQCFYEEEDHSSITMTKEEAHGRKNFGIDGSSFASVSNITLLQQPVGILVNVKEEIAPSISTPEAETTIDEKFLRDESSDEETLKDESSPLEMGDLEQDCNVPGGLPQLCEKKARDLRGESKIITQKIKRKPSHNDLPGELSLINNSSLSSWNAGNELKKSLSTNEDEPFQMKDAVIGDHISRKKSSMAVVSKDMSPKCMEFKSVRNQESKLFNCKMCGNEFKCKRSLTIHLCGHSVFQPDSLDNCGKNFLPKGHSVDHSVIHRDLRPFKCDTCGKRFLRKNNLKGHLNIHSGLRPFKCHTCGNSFTTNKSLNRHHIIHSGLKPFQCETCSRSFSDKSTLVKHLGIHMGLRPFKCDTCGKTFTQKGNLVTHVRIHSGLRPFRCDTCGKTFTQKAYLVAHSGVHSGMRNFKCDTCGKGFANRGNLNQHLILHRSFRPFKCDTCGKSFTLKRYLIQHIAIHIGLRPFNCDRCGKKFTRKIHLASHSLMHSGFKPYTCDKCGKGYAVKSSLLRHLGVHRDS